jgi:translation initiation factor 3 subunit F
MAALATTYGSSPALLLNTPPTSGADESSNVSNVVVHPIVLLSVLDHHTRRQEGAGRVIGTLLGRRDGETVEITNCFAVPHAERGDEVAIGKDFNRQMLALHLRANKRETVVGWYATALPDESSEGKFKFSADTSSLIHEFYASECEDDPIHLVVDTSLVNDAMELRAYKSTSVTVKNDVLANIFNEIRLSVKSSESEKICMQKMIEGNTPQGADASQDDNEALKVSMEKLLEMLETASTYVDSVLANKIEPDESIGRDIFESLNAIPRIRPEVFDKMFNDSLQDLLMVTYLSNVTKTQLSIAEKLNATLGK